MVHTFTLKVSCHSLTYGVSETNFLGTRPPRTRVLQHGALLALGAHYVITRAHGVQQRAGGQAAPPHGQQAQHQGNQLGAVLRLQPRVREGWREASFQGRKRVASPGKRNLLHREAAGGAHSAHGWP